MDGDAARKEKVRLDVLNEAADEIGRLVEERASRYHEEFPRTQLDAFRAQFAILITAGRLAHTVNSYMEACFGMNSARTSILRALHFADGGRLPQSELARGMKVTSPNVKQLVNKLEQDGYVERVPSDTDRRISYVQLTAAGRDLSAMTTSASAAFIKECSSCFTTDEMRELVDLLTRFSLNIPRHWRYEPEAETSDPALAGASA